jgi:hypothetical protein
MVPLNTSNDALTGSIRRVPIIIIVIKEDKFSKILDISFNVKKKMVVIFFTRYIKTWVLLEGFLSFCILLG